MSVSMSDSDKLFADAYISLITSVADVLLTYIILYQLTLLRSASFSSSFPVLFFLFPVCLSILVLLGPPRL